MLRFVRHGVRTALSVLCALAVTPAYAQTSNTAARWELEGYGGITSSGLSISGAGTLPVPGPTLTTSSVLFPTRQTSSWFFGDGAAMFNGASAEFGLATAIVPLDASLQSLGLEPGHASFGVRVRRRLTPRWSAELGIDVSHRSGDVNRTLGAALAQARDTFQSGFATLLATGPFSGIVVNATDTRTSGSTREIATTGAVNIYFSPRRTVTPYATIGAGIIMTTGTLPTATLEGDYRFTAPGGVPFHETDRVTVRYVQPGSAPAMVLGGGISHDLSARWGWRVDGRVLITGGGTELRLDATPTIATTTPGDFVESLTNPNLQFSNNTSTGRSSTLGGAPLQGFTAFDEGTRMRVVFAFGIFRRF